jgi:hypothetical protein
LLLRTVFIFKGNLGFHIPISVLHEEHKNIFNTKRDIFIISKCVKFTFVFFSYFISIVALNFDSVVVLMYMIKLIS